MRIRRVEGAPVVAIRVWVPGGARVERHPGECLVASRMLTEGTRRRDWLRIAEESEDRGMSIAGVGGFEGHGLAIEALAADWERALEWAAELTTESAFPRARFDWTVQQAAAEVDSLADQPAVITGWGFREQLYRPHPRCRPLQGSRSSLERLRPAACAEFHRRGVERGVVVTAAGRIDERRLRDLAAELFPTPGDDSAPPTSEPPPPDGSAPARSRLVHSGDDQAHLYLGHLTVGRRHPDHAALLLLGVVLGAGPGLTGRIPTRIREREGLAYTAHADTVVGAGIDPGRLVIYLGTSPGTVERAEAAAREELERLLDEGIGEEEAELARSYLLGREPFRRETACQWADILLEAVHTGLPVDRPEWLAESLAGVDRAELNRVAREHIRIDRLKVTVGLPGGKGRATDLEPVERAPA
jgi:zinc protease